MKKILPFLLAATTAHAATLTQTFSIPSQSTNWTQTWNANQFNPDLGCLQKVTLDLSGLLTGAVRGESLNYSASTYTYGINGSLIAYKGATPITGALVVKGHTDTLFPFDGVIDFGGISGFSHTYSDPLIGFTTLTTGLADFIGTGVLPLVWKTDVDFAGSGPGNFIWNVATKAGADARLIYTYTDCPPVHAPEPATGLLLLAGLLAMWGVRSVERRSGDKK